MGIMQQRVRLRKCHSLTWRLGPKGVDPSSTMIKFSTETRGWSNVPFNSNDSIRRGIIGILFISVSIYNIYNERYLIVKSVRYRIRIFVSKRASLIFGLDEGIFVRRRM